MVVSRWSVRSLDLRSRRWQGGACHEDGTIPGRIRASFVSNKFWTNRPRSERSVWFFAYASFGTHPFRTLRWPYHLEGNVRKRESPSEAPPGYSNMGIRHGAVARC